MRDKEIYFCFYNETGKHWVMVENLPGNMSSNSLSQCIYERINFKNQFSK